MNFPIGDKSAWGDDLAVKPVIKDWLFDPLSLTAKLKQQCQHFRVDLLGQAEFTLNEITQFSQVWFSESALVREVVLYCDDKPWVYAHTLVPVSTLNDLTFIHQLGTSPLGEALFKHPELVRKPFQVAEFNLHHPVFRFSQMLCAQMLCDSDVQSNLYGRRSIFYLKQKPLSVTEVFLPDCVIYHD